MQVQAVVPELTVEAFNERILSGISWLDEVQFHRGPLRPKEHRLAGQFRSVIHDYASWQTALFCKTIQFPS